MGFGQESHPENRGPKVVINDRFDKHSGTLGITSSKLFIDDRFYKQSGPLGSACSELYVSDSFYK